MSDRERNEAFITLATNDSYSIGALVLGQSLRNTGTRRQLVVMITHQVTDQMRDQLRGTFDALIVVDVLDSRDTANLNLLSRPDLGLTFTKLHCWRLTQFNKCVFLDADTLVLHNIDELFDSEELAAAPDVGWPDCFNSGVFVYRPSYETYAALINFALTRGSFDGGDQGLLNQYFSDWSTQGRSRRLPFIYNTVAQAFYSYAPAYKQYGHNVKVIHFIGSVKPWNVGYNMTTRTLEGGPYQATDFLQHWWNLFMDQVHHRLSDPLKQTLGTGSSPSHNSEGGGGDSWYQGGYTQQQLDDGHRQYNWEKGEIDYMGVDSFENIKRQLDTKIQPVNKEQAFVSPAYATSANGLQERPPVAKSRVVQALENQFREGSEFRKSSTDLVLPSPPRKSVHRTIVVLSPKVYREQVLNKAGPSAPKAQTSAGVSGAKAAAIQLPAAATPQPAAVQLPVATSPSAAAVQTSAAVSPQPAAVSPQPAAVSPQPAAVSPQAAAVSPQPAAVSPQPAAASPQPAVVSPTAAAPVQPFAATQQPVIKPASPSLPAAQPLGFSSPVSPGFDKKGAPISPPPQGQLSPTVGQGFHAAQGVGTPSLDDSGFVADAAFSAGPSPIAFSTPAPGVHLSGFPQSAVKASPTSPKAAFDPFSAQASYTAGSPTKTTDPFATSAGFDPSFDVKPGVGVSAGVSVHHTPASAGGGEFDEPLSQQQQQRSKKGGNKRGKK